MLKDILGALEAWPFWKRVKEAPGRIDALEQEIALLKRAITTQSPDPRPDCMACGAGKMAVTEEKTSSTPLSALGARDVTRTCTSCGHKSTTVEGADRH